MSFLINLFSILIWIILDFRLKQNKQHVSYNVILREAHALVVISFVEIYFVEKHFVENIFAEKAFCRKVYVRKIFRRNYFVERKFVAAIYLMNMRSQKILNFSQVHLCILLRLGKIFQKTQITNRLQME
jgi:hypothetical protein